jgi:hypothetical protein
MNLFFTAMLTVIGVVGAVLWFVDWFFKAVEKIYKDWD